MPSTVGQQVGRKMNRTIVELRHAQRASLIAGLTELKQGVEHRLPASRRLRGVGKKGAKIGVRYDLRGEDSGVVRAIGPLHLLERDTRPHEIKPITRGRGKNRKQRDGAIRLADGTIREAVQHPGTKGQHPFEKGIDAARPKALRAMANPITDAVKRGLRS